jgi:hypothetical protein
MDLPETFTGTAAFPALGAVGRRLVFSWETLELARWREALQARTRMSSEKRM